MFKYDPCVGYDLGTVFLPAHDEMGYMRYLSSSQKSESSANNAPSDIVSPEHLFQFLQLAPSLVFRLCSSMRSLRFIYKLTFLERASSKSKVQILQGRVVRLKARCGV